MAAPRAGWGVQAAMRRHRVYKQRPGAAGQMAAAAFVSPQHQLQKPVQPAPDPPVVKAAEPIQVRICAACYGVTAGYQVASRQVAAIAHYKEPPVAPQQEVNSPEKHREGHSETGRRGCAANEAECNQ